MIIKTRSILIVTAIALALAMVASPSIVSALAKDPIPSKDTDEMSEAIQTNNSESTTNFAKKGNTQTSPIPPECPKQGPIPPNCTLKPKF